MKSFRATKSENFHPGAAYWSFRGQGRGRVWQELRKWPDSQGNVFEMPLVPCKKGHISVMLCQPGEKERCSHHCGTSRDVAKDAIGTCTPSNKSVVTTMERRAGRQQCGERRFCLGYFCIWCSSWQTASLPGDRGGVPPRPIEPTRRQRA